MNAPHALTDINSFDSYLDVTQEARRVGIEYTVLLDDRMEILLNLANAGDVDEGHSNPITPALVALAFLLKRFPSMTTFRYSLGGKRDLDPHGGIPLVASFHHDKQRGYFVALSLDANDTALP